MTITVFYRDGGNYKFTLEFPFAYEQLTALADKKGMGVKAGDEVEYDNDLGITEAQFHEKLGYPHDPETDHNLVTIEGIKV